MQDVNPKYQELFAYDGPDSVDLNKPCVPHIIAIASRMASKHDSSLLCTAVEVKSIRKKLNKKMEKTNGLIIEVTDYKYILYLFA